MKQTQKKMAGIHPNTSIIIIIIIINGLNTPWRHPGVIIEDTLLKCPKWGLERLFGIFKELRRRQTWYRRFLMDLEKTINKTDAKINNREYVNKRWFFRRHLKKTSSHLPKHAQLFANTYW